MTGSEYVERKSSNANSFDLDGATRELGTTSSDAGGSVKAVVPGSMIGRYLAVEEVGRGAMGRVLRAYDPRLRREVALKEVLHTGDRIERVRLVAEARAMAKLSHGNVVAVYDVEGDEDENGPVVLVMEFVPGQNLSRWVKGEPRDWEDILELYSMAGRGLAAAHNAGLLHRDFKPSNVLVSDMRAGERDVKVTDFGLARFGTDGSDEQLEEKRVRRTMEASLGSEGATATGVVVGTPRYMAPEQLVPETDNEGVQLPPTPAVDQYSFCVSLWEGLCGTPPFRTPRDYQGLIDVKMRDPPRWPEPSTPRYVVNAIRRGLSVEPSDRWPDMPALLTALHRDPAQRRRKWIGVGGLLCIGAGLAGIGIRASQGESEQCGGAEAKLAGIWDSARRAEAKSAVSAVERVNAGDVWGRTEKVLDGYAQRWVALHRDACLASTVRGEESASLLDARMRCLHRAAVTLETTVDTLTDADTTVLDEAHNLVNSLHPLAWCEDHRVLDADLEPPLPREAAAVESVRRALARSTSERAAGRPSGAQRALEDAEAGLPGLVYGPVHAEFMLESGQVSQALGEFDDAASTLKDALRLTAQYDMDRERFDTLRALTSVLAASLKKPELGLAYRPLVEGLSAGNPERRADAHALVGNVLLVQGHYEEARAEFQRALERKVEVFGPEHTSVASTRNLLGRALEKLGRFEEAEAELRAALKLQERLLGPEHPRLAATRVHLGELLEERREIEAAQVEYDAALELQERVLGADHPSTINTRNNLAGLSFMRGDYAVAEREFRTITRLLVASLGPEHPSVARVQANLGSALAKQGRYQEAELELRGALQLEESALGAGHPSVIDSRSNLGALLRMQGKFAEAEAEHRAVLVLREAVLGRSHPDVAMSHYNLGIALESQGKTAEAMDEYRAAVEIREQVLDSDNLDLANSRIALAYMDFEAGRYDSALTGGELAWTAIVDAELPSHTRGRAAFLLAKTLWSVRKPRRDRPRARALAEFALEQYLNADRKTGSAEKVRRWLETHR